MWSMICFRFFLLLSKTKIFFAEFGFGCVAVVVSMTCFQVFDSLAEELTATSAFSGFFHSLLRFLFLVFAKKKRQEAGHEFKILDQTWTMIIVARAFGGQHYYVIMILILARSYIKRRVVVVVVYAYFLGEISQVDTFSFRTCDWPFRQLTAH